MVRTPNPDSRKIRVLLVDTYKLMRDGMRLSLEQEPDLAVVGEAGDSATALQLARQLRPEVIVIDINLPEGDGIEVSRQILREHPATHIVIHTCSVDREHLELALAAGIRHYVLKGGSADELHAAIRQSLQQKAYLSQDAVAALIERFQELRAEGPRNSPLPLSDRETTILKLMADGRNTKEIADQLVCSVKTVDYYRKRLLGKVGVHSVAELTKYAIRKGLTTP